METKKNLQLEYPWNFIDAVLKEPLSDSVDRAEVERGLEYLLSTLVSEDTRTMIELKYRDGMTQYAIAEQLGVTPSLVGERIRKAVRRFHGPHYNTFLKNGYAEGMKKNPKDLWESKYSKLDARRVPGTYPGHIHDIKDPCKRIDAIIERGGALSVWKLRLGTRASNILLRHHIQLIWHLCFYTEEELLDFEDCGDGTIARIVDTLYQWDLALDDGLLGSTEESLKYAEYAANLCDALDEQKENGGI
ncbi:sigma-70 family RNA polymerase sigma factor [Pseudoflavonifractor phocaeensis]|uniref:sigma-70 family RNA polymerase sigma factor n=1 Tax=Pseudoflavonifractor phocaeensis TaxID=1870988 RepID=UPI001F228358|nr:sigma-70 family RNA polymerase sigma factor [Pseudoflavonifractor phocaeensis]MCF2661168.1 sigma-70 family RNA polymerase sigma factor [Pseudoflavonifractor phocaeensis]